MNTSDLLPKLLKIQEEEGFLPEERLLKLADETNIPIAIVNETATFYTFLKMKKGGKYAIKVCNSPTCYLHRSENIRAVFEKLLGISIGEVTQDGKYSLEKTSCIGCCDHAPAALINDQLHTKMTEEKIKELLAQCK